MSATVNEESDKMHFLQAACEVAHAAHVPVWFEPVSVPKAVRATTVLKRLSYTSPNAHELIAMAAALDPVHNTDVAKQLLLQMAAGTGISAVEQLHLLAPFILSVLKVSCYVWLLPHAELRFTRHIIVLGSSKLCCCDI